MSSISSDVSVLCDVLICFEVLIWFVLKCWFGCTMLAVNRYVETLLSPLSPGGCDRPTQRCWCVSEYHVFVQRGTRDQGGCSGNHRCIKHTLSLRFPFFCSYWPWSRFYSNFNNAMQVDSFNDWYLCVSQTRCWRSSSVVQPSRHTASCPHCLSGWDSWRYSTAFTLAPPAVKS